MSRALACLLLWMGCGERPETVAQPAPAEPVWSLAFDTSTAGSLSGVWGSSPADVFVVGGSEEGAEIHHYDGERWTVTRLPDAPLLIWAHGFGPHDVYAVGVAGTMVHYDGDGWARIATGTTKDLWGIFGFSPDDLWIVGGDPFEGDPLILHYDGLTFSTGTIDATLGAHALFKVWGTGGVLFAVGQRGLVLQRAEGAWSPISAGPLADEDFVSLWGASTDRIIAVGGRQSARIGIWDGARWETEAPELNGLNGVHMPSPDLAVIGGIAGFVGRFDPTTKEVVREADLTHLDIHAVWGDGQGCHYAVGGTFTEPHRGVALLRTSRDP